MSTLAHKQEVLAYQARVARDAIVRAAQAQTFIRDLHMNIGREAIEQAIREGVIQRTAEAGVYFSLIKDPRG